MIFLRSAFLVLVVLAGTLSLQAASEGHSTSYPSGTYRGRILTELFRHQQASTRRGQAAALAEETPVLLRQDSGNIAIIDDSGGVVLRPNSFDLNQISLTITRSNGSHTVEPSPLGFSEEAKDRGAPLDLADDDAERIFLPFPFPFFGEVYKEAFVHSDGNLSFVEPEASSTSRSLSRAIGGPPRIAPLFTDLDPSAGGAVSIFPAAGRFVITWDDVPEFTRFGGGRRQTFQLVLREDGGIDFHYASINLTSMVVGIMPGRLLGETTAADLSEGFSDPASGAIAEIFTQSVTLDTVAATQKFYRNHSDAYDYVVVFNNMGLQAGPGAFAFELNIRNEVEGIGSPQSSGNTVFDFGPSFGSENRLQSFLNMGPLRNYPADPTSRIPLIGENNTLTVLLHEAGHRFLAYARFLDPNTQRPSNALRGRQGAHWSFFFNSDASVLEGNRIEDAGMVSPRFETTGAVEQYSDLDLYLMGYQTPDEVPPTFLVEAPSIPRSPSSPPATGVTFDGERKNISLDMIIAAEGERRPDTSVSQKDFNLAFILVVTQESEPPPEDIEKLDRIRAQWQEFFDDAVSRDGAAHTELVKLLSLSTWPAAGVIQGLPATATVRIDSPLEADLEVLLTADNGAISIPSVVTIPAGQMLSSFEISGNNPGITNLTATASLPGFDTARTIVEVKDDFSDLSLAVESGDNQSAGEGSALPHLVVFRVRDRNKLHYPGVPVTLEASGNGEVTPSQAVTDAMGRVTVEWRLSDDPFNALLAEVEGQEGLAAVATAFSLGPRPAFSAAGVVNAANFNSGTSSLEPVLTPGGLYSIFGSTLSSQTQTAISLPLPRQIEGTTVLVNGTLAPLLFVSPLQVNFQAPFEISGSTAEILVSSSAGSSELVTVDVAQAQPGIFFNTQSGFGAILNEDGTLATLDNPGPGEVVQIFATGLGLVEPPAKTGLPAAASPLAQTLLTPEVQIGGNQAPVVFSGLAPFFAGLYQVNAEIPEDQPAGVQGLRLHVGGIESNEVLLEVE